MLWYLWRVNSDWQWGVMHSPHWGWVVVWMGHYGLLLGRIHGVA